MLLPKRYPPLDIVVDDFVDEQEMFVCFGFNDFELLLDRQTGGPVGCSL